VTQQLTKSVDFRQKKVTKILSGTRLCPLFRVFYLFI
jgi:hypothetical protein